MFKTMLPALRSSGVLQRSNSRAACLVNAIEKIEESFYSCSRVAAKPPTLAPQHIHGKRAVVVGDHVPVRADQGGWGRWFIEGFPYDRLHG